MSTSEITSQEFRVPVFLTGIVNKLEGIDFCMDGATHGLQTLLGLARLRPSNEEADGFLDHVSGTRLRVTVAGYPVRGPECGYISVYYAASAEETIKSLGLKL